MDYLLGLCWNLGFDPLGGPNSEKQIKLWFFSSIVGIWAEFIDQGFFLSLRWSQGVKDEFNGSIICGCMSCTFLYQEINLQNMVFSHCFGLHRYSLLWGSHLMKWRSLVWIFPWDQELLIKRKETSWFGNLAYKCNRCC